MTSPELPKEPTEAAVDRYEGLRRGRDAVRAAKAGAPMRSEADATRAVKTAASAKPVLRAQASPSAVRPTSAGLVVSAPRPEPTAQDKRPDKPVMPLVSHEYPVRPTAGRTTSFEAMKLGLKQLGRDPEASAQDSADRPKALDAKALANVNQEAMMQRVNQLIDSVGRYYHSNPAELAAEKLRLRALPERELQAALISYQTVSDHVLVRTDVGFAQRAALSADKKVMQWYAQHGTNEEEVETVRAERLLAHRSTASQRSVKPRASRP